MCKAFAVVCLLAAVFVSKASAASGLPPLTLRMSIGPRSDIQPGGRVKIDCTFQPAATYIFWRFSANNGISWDKLALCHADSGKCSLQEQFRNWTDRLVTLVNGSLTLVNAIREQDGIYECEGIRNTDAAKDNRSVTIITTPGKPTVSASTSDTVVEGSRLNVTCQSVGGNPPPQLLWSVRHPQLSSGYSPLDPMSPLFSWQPTSEKFGQTTASASVLAKSTDNEASIVCETVHPLGNVTSAELVIKVLYAPKLASVESLRAIAGSSVSFNCTADSNPSATLVLLKGNATVAETSQQTLQHTIAASTRSDTGAFACLAKNSIGSVRRSFSLTVLYPPAVVAPNSITVREGARLQADCGVTAEPPPFTVNWRHAGSGRLLGNSSRLLISSAARTDAGEWICEARNLMSPSNGQAPQTGRGSATVQVTVQYPPGMPVVAFTAGAAVAQAGTRVVLECRPSLLSPGVPEPAFSWTVRTGASTRVATGPTLTLESADLKDSGEYACVPENSAGRGPAASVSLTVEQPPRWLDGAGADDDESALTTTTTTTSVGVGGFALICAVRGRPACEVVWSRNGRELDPGAYSVNGEFDPALFVTRSTLRFVGPRRSILQPEDNGAYSCSAQNSHGKISRIYNLVVEFPPLIKTSKTKLAMDPAAAETSLECLILAQPKPKVTWEIGSNSYVSNVSQDTLTPYKHRATLFGVRSLGRFTCVARNALGEARHSIEVVARSSPDPPTDFRLSALPAWDRVSLSWQPGFDGGLQASMWLRCNPPPEGRSLGEPIRIDNDLSGATNLTGLYPATNYTLTVFAKNQLGSGPNSVELRFTTPELAMPTVTGLRRDGTSAKTLLLDSWPTGYCLRVEAASLRSKQQQQQHQQSAESDAADLKWHQVKLKQALCQAPTDGRLTGLDLNSLTYRLALCLTHRQAVCGPAVTTESMTGFPEVSSLTIIIVAAFCTLLIICLVAILVFFCCRNRPLAGKEAASSAASADAAASAARASDIDSPPMRREGRSRRHQEPDLMASTYKSFGGNKPYAMVSPHPSLTSTDETSIEQTNKVFSTLLSANHPIVGNNNLESGSDNSGTFLHPGRQRKVIYEVVV